MASQAMPPLAIRAIGSLCVPIFTVGYSRNPTNPQEVSMKRAALALATVGALNWLSVGLFQKDLVASIFGGQDKVPSRTVYSLVGVAGAICAGVLINSVKHHDELEYELAA